jgi:multidrug efflux system outer membrane protein
VTKATLVLSAAAALLAGCASSPPPTAPDVPVTGAPSGWWTQLHDPAIDALSQATLDDSPTLAQAVARIDEARAALSSAEARRLPTVGANASATRARSLDTTGVGASTLVSSTASVGPSFSWELDLFGRLRYSREAAQRRLDARTADAAGVRLSVVADVASGVLQLRACESTRRVLAADIASREATLALTRQRLAAGFVAPVDEARAVSGLAAVRVNLETQTEQCARYLNALVALSGREGAAVRTLLALPLTDASAQDGTEAVMPRAPAFQSRLPATVLANHPSVLAAARDADAARADIAVARADHLPRLDLSALLAGQWLNAAGTSLYATTWSLGPALSAVLFDGGAGAANISAAEARWRGASATLRGALRNAVQDTENALAAAASADARMAPAQESVDAARRVLDALQAQWQVGAVSLFELEDARRQFATAQDNAITAARDRAQAWVALVRASGQAPFPSLLTSEAMESHEERRLSSSP